MHRWPCWLTALTLLIAAADGARGAEATSAAQTPAQALAAVDQFFLSTYARAVREVLPDDPPAFLVLSDRLILYRHGDRREWPLIPPLFNELKDIAHVTLGLFAILSPTNGGPLRADDALALRRYQDVIATARSALHKLDLPV